ncbi:MAG TPA: gluconokinase, GntK/IdnK-type [Ilumatobacteraceae bacterium]
MTAASPVRVVVMGVAGSGKTTIGTALAERMTARFLDADAAHPAENIAKMAAGIPLTDADRWPWLARLRHELRGDDPIVVTCSALKRSYRDMLRGAGDVRFVLLDIDPATARDRTASREGHFMRAEMVSSQFDTFERPQPDELDVAVVDASRPVADVVGETVAALAAVVPGCSAVPLLADGGPGRSIDDTELAARIDEIVRDHVAPAARRVLLVPPDHTRLHSRAGDITVLLLEGLERTGREVGVLPALGTHAAMRTIDAQLMFGAAIPADRLLHHDWRAGLRTLGEISGAEVAVISAEAITEPIPVAVDARLLDGWDLVISVGQVVPHEVIGMANFTKNIVIGLGGAPTVNHSHFLGAVAGMEAIMGRVTSPVRDVVDAAFDRYVAPVVDVLWVLTVVEDAPDGKHLRGLYAGRGSTASSGGAAYRAAADLAARANVTVVPRAFTRVVCWLDPSEFHSTWLGNKAIYRTRMAIADGGELIILGPGVDRFGEDPAIDALVRRHGYRGTPATLAAVRADPDLAVNLGAAAHLIHGSSEGRFTITWCTDPRTNGLPREDLEAAGYAWRSLPDELAHLGIDATATSGRHLDRDGRHFDFIVNPGLGLWTSTPIRATP